MRSSFFLNQIIYIYQFIIIIIEIISLLYILFLLKYFITVKKKNTFYFTLKNIKLYILKERLENYLVVMMIHMNRRK